MKRIIIGLSLIFIGSQLFMSCSSENAVVSQFSKRKYLKNFKENKLNNDDKIIKKTNDYELVKVAPSTKNTNEILAYNSKNLTTQELTSTNFTLENEVVVYEDKIDNQAYESLKPQNKYNWSNYNRTLNFTDMTKANEVFDGNNIAQHHYNARQVDEVVLIILGIFIPPLAVYLYEDAITSNFWVDLILTFIFWIPGIIFAFLVMFGGLSFV